MLTQRLGGAVACIATLVLATSVASGEVATEPPQSPPSPVETASEPGATPPEIAQPSPAPAPAAPATSAAAPDCERDNDCPEGARCAAGVCKRKKKKEKKIAQEDDVVVQAPKPAVEGEICGGDQTCGAGLTCYLAKCVRDENVPPAARLALGIVYQGSPGLGGEVKNPVPAQSFGLTLEVPIKRVRYAVTAAAETLGAYRGVRFLPGTFSFPIAVSGKPVPNAYVEPGVDVLVVEALFSETGHAIAFGSALWLRGTVHFGDVFVSVTPIGLEVRSSYIVGDSSVTSWPSAFGFNWVGRAMVGMSL